MVRDIKVVLKELALEYEMELLARYGGTQSLYPSQKRKWERDRAIIDEALKLCE